MTGGNGMKRWGIAFILLICCLFSGCSKNETKKQQEYLIYGLENGKAKLKAIPYRTETTDRDQLIEELVDQFMNLKENGAVSALTNKSLFRDYKLENKILYLDFQQGYQSIAAIQEVLCRGALVLTFMQVDGIDSVSVTVNHQPLIDKSGNPIQTQKESDFVDVIQNGLNEATKMNMILYFSDEEGSSLLKREVEVLYNGSYQLESAVVNCLIEGPKDDSCKATLSPNVKLLGVSVKDGICYVNLDQTFLDERLNTEAYIPIYSIVNSLAELPGVQKVQILVDGKSDIMYRDVISLKDPLERKLEYIGGKNN